MPNTPQSHRKPIPIQAWITQRHSHDPMHWQLNMIPPPMCMILNWQSRSKCNWLQTHTRSPIKPIITRWMTLSSLRWMLMELSHTFGSPTIWWAIRTHLTWLVLRTMIIKSTRLATRWYQRFILMVQSPTSTRITMIATATTQNASLFKAQLLLQFRAQIFLATHSLSIMCRHPSTLQLSMKLSMTGTFLWRVKLLALLLLWVRITSWWQVFQVIRVVMLPTTTLFQILTLPSSAY